MPVIRVATIQDLAEVAALFVELSHHHRELEPDLPRYQVSDREWYDVARRTLLDDSHTVLVAEEEGSLVAFVNFHFAPKPWGRSCEIDTLAVTESYRGTGIGSALMEKAQEAARRAGAGGMRVEVLESNEAGRTFYEKAGYSVIAIRYGKPID